MRSRGFPITRRCSTITKLIGTLARRSCASLGVAVLVAACTGSSGGERAVFKVGTDFSQGGPATTIDVVDVGLPLLYNQTQDGVTLRQVSLVAVPESVRFRVYAYRYSQVRSGVGIIHGDLLKRCRHADTPYKIADVVVPPHSYSKWVVVIAIRFTKPGRYVLRKAKVRYRADASDGWQYQNLNTTIAVTSAPQNAKPAFDGCL